MTWIIEQTCDIYGASCLYGKDIGKCTCRESCKHKRSEFRQIMDIEDMPYGEGVKNDIF